MPSLRVDVSFRPRSLVSFKIISVCLHDINKYSYSSPQARRRIRPFSSTTVIRVYIVVNKNSNTEVSMYAAAKSYMVSLNDVTFSPHSTNMFSQSGSINFLFSQSSSVTMLLTDPCSYLLRSQFLALYLISRAIFK